MDMKLDVPLFDGADGEGGGNGDVFLDILDSPKLLPLVRKLLLPTEQDIGGGGAAPPQLVCGALPVGRMLPPNPGEGGYCTWHRDLLPLGAWPHAIPRNVKCMTVFFDVEEDGGPTAIVPRSHRLPEGPEQTLSPLFKGGGQLDGNGAC